MARSYRRDARGRFAGGGYSGQTGGRGARLMAKGQRAGGGVKMKAARVGGTVSKPRGLKPGAVKVKPAVKVYREDYQSLITNPRRIGSGSVTKKEASWKSSDSVGKFTKGMSPAAATKARAALAGTRSVNGIPTRLDRLIERKVGSGYSVVVVGGKTRLQSASGAYLTEAQVTKTGMKYAQTLTSRVQSRRR